MRVKFVRGALLALMLNILVVPNASAWEEQATNPFPGVAFGEAIPGYLKTFECPQDWSEDPTCVINTAFMRAQGGLVACPEWSANDNTNFYRADGSVWKVESWCRASWTAPVSAADEAAYEQAIRDATAAAEAESRAWNEANPGKQKCVSWGPIRHPNGVGESSGGVCANPVPAGSAPSGSSSSAAGSVGESDIAPVPTQDSSSSAEATSSSPVAALPADPPPPATAYRGSGYPFTQIVEGQVGLSGCPVGFQAANGLISDVGARKTYTECWPERAWAAYRLGGEAWELYKATGGNYDPSVEIDRRNKVELLKAKAKAVAEVAALLTPGIERCSSWSGFGESGTECAYAFIAPSSSSASIGSSTSSSGAVIASQSSTASVEVPSSESGDLSASGEIGVALSSVSVAGTSLLISRQAIAITPDPVEASSISQLADGLTAVKTVQRDLLQSLPRDSSLDYKVVSLTPSVCKASSFRVRITTTGLCKVGIAITDSAGNEYEIIKKMRRKF